MAWFHERSIKLQIIHLIDFIPDSVSCALHIGSRQ